MVTLVTKSRDGTSRRDSVGCIPVTRTAPLGLPAPLVVAASLTAIEGVVTVILGIAEAASLSSDRVVMGLTTAAFFIVYGAGLAYCAWGIRRLQPWSRSPVLLAQLIWLGLAWNFRESPTTVVAIALAVAAVIVIVGLLHPDSVDRLNREEHRRTD